MSRFTLAVTLLWPLLLASCCAFEGGSPPVAGELEELEVLKAAADGAITRNCDYVSIRKTLGVRERDVSGLLLHGIFEAPEESLGATRDLAAAFWTINSGGTSSKLSSSQQRLLGQKRPRFVHFVTGKRGCKVRLSRVGWSTDHQHALVYVGLQQDSLPGAVLLELERRENGWRVAKEWARFETIILD